MRRVGAVGRYSTSPDVRLELSVLDSAGLCWRTCRRMALAACAKCETETVKKMRIAEKVRRITMTGGLKECTEWK